MIKKNIIFMMFFTSFLCFSQRKAIDDKVNSLLKKMTIEEKIGQLNQYSGDNAATGPITINSNK